MKPIIYLTVLSCFFISCKEVTKKDAEEIVEKFLRYKNNHYDGAGVAHAEIITITKIIIDTDTTGQIYYRWSGEYMDPIRKDNLSPKFLPVSGIDDNLNIVKENNKWTYYH
jgi:phosphorylcholine metabolism protein LicD